MNPSVTQTLPQPKVATIQIADLRAILAKGVEDFNARPTHAVFLVAIYPIVAVILARLTSGYQMLPLFFPLLSGFALLGPMVAWRLIVVAGLAVSLPILGHATWHLYRALVPR